MHAERTYHTAEAPAPILITLNPSGTATELIALAQAEQQEEGYCVREVADSAPHPAAYAAITEAVIALRYSIGAEIALNRLPDDDDEKIAYLAFVSEAKAAARQALRLAGYEIA